MILFAFRKQVWFWIAVICSRAITGWSQTSLKCRLHFATCPHLHLTPTSQTNIVPVNLHSSSREIHQVAFKWLPYKFTYLRKFQLNTITFEYRTHGFPCWKNQSTFTIVTVVCLPQHRIVLDGFDKFLAVSFSASNHLLLTAAMLWHTIWRRCDVMHWSFVIGSTYSVFIVVVGCWQLHKLNMFLGVYTLQIQQIQWLYNTVGTTALAQPVVKCWLLPQRVRFLGWSAGSLADFSRALTHSLTVL